MTDKKMKQDLELKRLQRIEKLIVAFTALLAIIALLMKKPYLRVLDVLVGGALSFFYFFFLTKTMYGAFYSPEQDQEEISISPRMVMKVTVLSIVSVVVTLALLIPKICLPVGFLIGFSSMFISILSDGVFTGMFGTLKPKQ
jgi:preprotein translocase subunit Sec61beta